MTGKEPKRELDDRNRENETVLEKTRSQMKENSLSDKYLSLTFLRLQASCSVLTEYDLTRPLPYSQKHIQTGRGETVSKQMSPVHSC